MKKILSLVLIFLTIICLVFLVMDIKTNIKLNELKNNINELEKLKIENDEKINDLDDKLNNLILEKELLNKEYQVWLRQNQKLEDLLH